MTREYSALTLAPLAAKAHICEPPLPRVSLDDMAISVLTDLRQVPAARAPANSPSIPQRQIAMTAKTAPAAHA